MMSGDVNFNDLLQFWFLAFKCPCKQPSIKSGAVLSVKVFGLTGGICISKFRVEKPITIPTTSAHPIVKMRRRLGERKTILVIDTKELEKNGQVAGGTSEVKLDVCKSPSSNPQDIGC